MNRCWRVACFVLLSGGLWGGSFAELAIANHEIQFVHREFRDRIHDLDAWYRDSLEEVRCRFDRERERIECAMREARRLQEPERRYHLDGLRHAMDDLHCRYRDEKRNLHDRYTCRRNEIHAWFRQALKETRRRAEYN